MSFKFLEGEGYLTENLEIFTKIYNFNNFKINNVNFKNCLLLCFYLKFNKVLAKFVEEGNIVNSGILIINKSDDQKSILLLKRKDYKHWELPGGKVELKDKSTISKYLTLKTAALREAKEEIGIDFKNKLLDCKPFFIDFVSPDGKHRRSYKFISLYNKVPKNIEDSFTDCKYIFITELYKYKLAPNVIILNEMILKGLLNKF